MKKKKFLSMLITVLMIFSPLVFSCAKVHADGDSNSYTVILKSGEGSGTDVTITEQSDSNTMWYITPIPPESFSSPAGNKNTFSHWMYNGNYVSPGQEIQLTNTSDNILTAIWNDSSYTLETPDSVDIKYYGYTDIDCKLTDLHLGVFTKFSNESADTKTLSGNKRSQACGITFEYYKGTLKSGDKTIPYTVYSRLVPKDIPSGESATSTKFWNLVVPGDNSTSKIFPQDTFQMTVYIDPEDYNSAEPGTYTGDLKYTGIYTTYPTFGMINPYGGGTVRSGETKNSESSSWVSKETGESGTIPLTLTIESNEEEENEEETSQSQSSSDNNDISSLDANDEISTPSTESSDTSNTSPSSYPKTGDQTNIMPLIIIAAISVLGFSIAIIWGRKYYKEKHLK